MQAIKANSDGKCFHCGEPLNQTPSFEISFQGKKEQTCCVGCQAVAQAIINQGLGAYYTQRQSEGKKIDAIPEDILQQLNLFDDAEIQASFVTKVKDEQEASLILEGITCAACIWLNEQTIRRLDGVTFVSINYSNARATVRWQPAKIRLSAILEAIRHIGYAAYPFDASKLQTIQNKERKDALKRLFIAGFGMMQVMMYAWPAYFATAIDLPFDQDLLLKWASLVLTVPVVTYSALPFLKGAARDLRAKTVGMDTPVALGILGAFIPSVWATAVKHGPVYFDSVTMFVFLLLLGRFFEYTARQKASENTDRLTKLIPTFAHKLVNWPKDNQSQEEAVSRIKPGDFILVKTGETVPVDGILRHGQSKLVESMLTGESRPITKALGEEIIAGSMNHEQPIVIETTHVGNDTKLSAIVRLLDNAVSSKPLIAEVANKYASWFVIAILIVASATAYFWYLHDPSKALWITVSVLVITCPCALSLAVPVTLTAATGALASKQLLIAKGHALTTLANITDIVFDKTGTLTTGELAIEKIIYFDDQHLTHQILHTLESQSEHPLARAICTFEQVRSATLLPILDFHISKGLGIEGYIDGQAYRLGHPSFVQAFIQTLPEQTRLDTNAPIYLAKNNKLIAAIYISDKLRADANTLIKQLKDENISIHIASGDQSLNVKNIATSLEINDWHANCSPKDKLTLIESLQLENKTVCMIGDGVNDAPVLAKAQVSIAIGSGADIAQQHADMILADSHLSTILTGIKTAKKTKQIIQQNLVWGLGYNLIAIPLAITGYVTPLIAGVGMASSSLIVVLNALRLARK
ncbi:cadmium-translocating P-type ATPase [Leeia sp. TBRC 13508]|uniref:Cadmium-translocating P-type ATPase n=1 Tax=Leeia speluncae TaxID=2884804 RepID=A0ABS8D931_9NEIS|nr:heavy metal translocating P-type ATPase [Leeia speluncae]MCB6184726.1 cadmium-translocating P-type ATPase [Leeia speluncae]